MLTSAYFPLSNENKISPEKIQNQNFYPIFIQYTDGINLSEKAIYSCLVYELFISEKFGDHYWSNQNPERSISLSAG